MPINLPCPDCGEKIEFTKESHFQGDGGPMSGVVDVVVESGRNCNCLLSAAQWQRLFDLADEKIDWHRANCIGDW